MEETPYFLGSDDVDEKHNIALARELGKRLRRLSQENCKVVA
jgi:hypothetical protein